jgi:PPOX class probable F420-dependent enzyme
VRATTRRDRTVAKLNEKQQQFLENPFVGVVTTLRPDGSPHSTVVWVDQEDGEVSFNTAYGRTKPSNLEHDPRISLVVIDPNDTYKWIAVDGRASLTTDGADGQIDRLAKKYLGKDEYPFRKAEEQRVTVKIDTERVQAYGLD